MQGLVSVVVPAFNRGFIIDAALERILVLGKIVAISGQAYGVDKESYWTKT